MRDRRLVGYWSDKNLYMGSMAAREIAFRADGTGWTYSCDAAKGFEVVRFTWRQASRSALTLRAREYAGGDWSLGHGDRITHRVTSQSARDERIILGYEITAGQNVNGRPATLLQVDQGAIRTVIIGKRFALERELAANEHDPAYRPDRRKHHRWRARQPRTRP
jgi:hypothetical protein